MNKPYQKSTSSIIIVALLASLLITMAPTAKADLLTFTLNLNKNSFYIREAVQITGNLTYGPFPLQDGLIALQIKAPSGQLAFRTLDTGNVTNTDWPITAEIATFDNNKLPTNNFTVSRPLPSPQNLAWVNITVRNNRPYAQTIYIGLTTYDAANMAISGSMIKGPITLQMYEERIQGFQQWIPNYATPGEALICASIYNFPPAFGGFAVRPETKAHLNILSYYGQPVNKQANPDNPAPIGSINTTIGLSADAMTQEYGNYTLYANIYYKGSTALLRNVFNVRYAKSPPQASFFTKPVATYVNTTITFNATTASAEGFNDTGITTYTWNFGDGYSTGPLTSFTTTHKYTNTGTFPVTLNVTDSEGLWCIVKKPVVIIPPSPPIADFTWSPPNPIMNQFATFNASTSLPGFNGTHNFPIVSYQWDFGDTNTTTVAVPAIIHKYTAVANYTVTLTVTDDHSLQNNTTKIVQVINQTLPGDANGDGKVDGKDVAIVAKAYNTHPGDPLWDPRADLNGDLKVDGKDVAIVAKNYGKTLSGFSLFDSFGTGGFKTTAVARSVVYVPQAILAYYPTNVYGNVSTTYDASHSSPEGINDTFTNYKWGFNDGTPTQETTTPTTTHTFIHAGTFTVTVNATDTEGLWCAMTKPVIVRPPDPPVAAFTWVPQPITTNETATFDASTSLPGFNGTHNIPITSYKWSFGDGNITTVPGLIIRHKYTVQGNYTVTLTVTDANGFQGSKTQNVTVQDQPHVPGDANGDGVVDGKDVAIVSKAYNTHPGDPAWDPRADLNGDLVVDGKDIAIVSKYYGT